MGRRGASETRVRRLPVALRAWSVAGRTAPPDVQRTVAGRLATRFLASGRPYRAAGGYVFAVDRADPFQAAMSVGLFDPLVEAVLKRFARPGSTAIDAGGHLGYFTLRMATSVGLSGAVHTFEPDPRLFPRLSEHVSRNGFDWVTVNQCGLLDRKVELEFALPDQLGWGSVIAGAWGATRSTRVPMVALDEYVERRGIRPRSISVVKLDVEGAELPALRGACETLRQAAAAVLVEYLPGRIRATGADPADLLALMDELGYVAWTPVPERRGFSLRRGVEPVVGEDVLFLPRNTTAR